MFDGCHMRYALIDFFKLLEAAVPPPLRCHHALMYAQFGSDEAGWEDRLAIQVNRAGTFHTFFLDDDDFNDKSENEIVREIADLLAAPTPANAQLTSACGDFSREGEPDAN